jgi:hypothetical protein
MSEELNDAILSGDPAAIEAALAASGYSEEDEVGAEKDESEATDDAEVEAEPAAKDEPSGDDNGDTSSHEKTPVIKSKDGEHDIPYAVLEAARKEAAQLRADLQEANSKIEANQSAIDNAKTRMERNGVNVEDAFSDPDAITEKDLRDVEEDYGVNSIEAKNARTMFRLQQQQIKNVNQAEQVAEKAQGPSPEVQSAVNAALSANPDLAKWQTSDPDRWDMAKSIDERLKDSPAWAGKTFEERFAEAERLTKQAFGDPATPEKSAKDRAKEIIDKVNPSVPESLSDIGQTPTAEKSLKERLEGMSEGQIQDEMANMTQAQIDEVLSWY